MPRSVTPAFHSPDSVLVFNRDTAGFKAERSGKLLHVTERHLLVEAEGRIRPVPLKEVDRISICPIPETTTAVALEIRPDSLTGTQIAGRANDRVKIIALSIDDDETRIHLAKRGWTNSFNAWADPGGLDVCS